MTGDSWAEIRRLRRRAEAARRRKDADEAMAADVAANAMVGRLRAAEGFPETERLPEVEVPS